MFCNDSVEQEVCPQRGADEVQAVDRDGLPVEQRHAVALALSGELAVRILDVVSIELVIARHVEDVLRAAPSLGDVAGEDDQFDVWGERRDGVPFELDVEV